MKPSSILFYLSLWVAPLFGANTIRIGHVNSMTGPEAAFGSLTDKGVRLAVDEINEKGGVLGKKIELISLDDESKSDVAVTAITRLLTQDKVVAVLGESASTRTLAMAPIAQQAKIPLVSTSATNPKVTQIGDYIFRVCFIDPYQGPVVARFALSTLKTKRLAILKDIRNDYSIGLAKFFSEAVKNGGAEIVAEQSYSAGDVEYRAQLNAIRTAKPDAIFIPGYYTDVGLIARQAREMGLRQPLLGGDGWDSSTMLQVAGSALNGSYFANHYSPEDTSPRVKNFVDRFKKAYGVEPNSSAALGFDAARVVADAMTRAKSMNPEALRDALAKTVQFPGVTGNITINADRNAEKPAVILQVKNGQIHFHSSVTL